MKKTSVSTLAILTALLFAAFPPAPLEAQAWAYVSAGVAHGAAIATDGSLWTWGNNNSGQLGIGTSGWDTDTNIPVRVGTDTNWALVSVGATHTVAVRTDGSLWAWGSNWRGQLGIGTSGRGTDTNTPVRVGTDTNWASVSAGWEYTMAIRTDGSLWAWGDNNWWRLGIGTSGNPHTPTRVGSETDWASVSAGPSGEHPFANGVVYLTGSHTAAVTTTGELWVWGTNTWGQLGDGTGGTSNFHTSPIRIGADSNWASVSVGWNRTAAIKTDGTLWLWRGRPGNLNFNEETWSYTTAPDAVWERPEQEGTETWSFVSVSRNSTLAIRADGTLWLWGSRFVWDPDLGWDANGEQITR